MHLDKKAWAGNFIGPGPNKDPYKILDSNNPSRFLTPMNITDALAQVHDKGYFDKGADGVKGALFDLNVTPDDRQLANGANAITIAFLLRLTDPITKEPVSVKTSCEAFLINQLFSRIATYKEAIIERQR